MTAKVSLIIPIYNAEKYLQPCLDSVAAQTIFSQTQVLLVDDGSVDSSGQICDAFAKEHSNVFVIHKENGGVSAARNTGIEQSCGKYIAFADADDLLMPEMLEQLVDAVQGDGVHLSFCEFQYGKPDDYERMCYPFTPNVRLETREIAEFLMKNETLNALWNKLFLREIILRYDIRMTVGKRLGEDREFVLRYLARCEGACYVPCVGYFYRYVETGAIRKKQSGYAQVLTTQYQCDMECFAQLGFERNVFVKESALCFCNRIAATIDRICRTTRSFDRMKTLRTFYADAHLQGILAELLPVAASDCNRYTLSLLKSMEKKCCVLTRMLMLGNLVHTRFFEIYTKFFAR
ncbi:MAG: glycosyltransferase family 2 protein [Acutalibacteraceae bacterium]